jgi:hypothetical protein
VTESRSLNASMCQVIDHVTARGAFGVLEMCLTLIVEVESTVQIC